MSYYNQNQFPNQNGNFMINPSLQYQNQNFNTQLTTQFPGQSPASLLQLLQSTQMQAAHLMNMNLLSQPQYQQPMQMVPQESCALCSSPLTNERIFLEFDTSQNRNLFACSPVCKNLWFARTGRIPDSNEVRKPSNFSQYNRKK